MANTRTAHGLVSGTVSTIVGFEWPAGHRTEGQQPRRLHNLFDDCKVGIMTRSSAEHVPIIICPVTATFKSKIGMHNRMACPYSRV